MALSAANKKKLRQLSYLAGFFLSLNTALTAYINSSFLEQFVGERTVGLFYVASSSLMILASLWINQWVHRIGSKHVLLGLSIANITTLVTLLAIFSTPAAVLLVMLYLIINYLLTINLDLYLEQVSTDGVTGQIRGIYLTLVNLAWLVSPLLSTTLVGSRGFAAVYLLAVAALIPLLYLVTQLKKVEIVHYSQSKIRDTLKQIIRGTSERSRNLRRIMWIDFTLNFFYATMVIYIPIYLHQFIGFDWPTIGKILTVMLVPFVILDFILGHLADKLTGEKEILITGLLIAGLSVSAVGLLNSPLAIVWAATLFATRIGAASIEMMKESYLFKQIDGGDINTIFISRNAYPLSYVIAPIVASLLLLFLPYHYLFFLLGAVVFAAVPVAAKLKDTK